MGWFLNLKTGHKLALAFTICLALATIVGATAIARMSQMNRATEMLNSDALGRMKVISRITADCKQYRIFQYRHAVEMDASEWQITEGLLTATAASLDKDFADYVPLITMDEDRTNLGELKTRWGQYAAYNEQLMAADHAHDRDKAHKLLTGAMKQSYDAAMAVNETMVAWNVRRGDTLAADAKNTYSAARAIVIGLLSLAILMGIFMAAVVTKVITSSLARVSERLETLTNNCVSNLDKAMQALAEGNLTVNIAPTTQAIEIQSTDEFGTLAQTFNTMLARVKATIGSFSQAQESLSRLIAQTRTAADNITSSADEVSTGNTDLSQRTSEQASNLEETAASMEEMTATVKQNADNSHQANQLAAHARELAEKGGAVVTNAVAAMAEISHGSKRISEIISVIDEIAFQTNLLALNASVEAARVGEQGRGFAVVAAEVRNLAGRSATAAKEIKSLVGDTVQKVQDGSDLVNQSGSQLGEIVGSVKKVADIIAEISAASGEQSTGIEQVNRAVIQMDQMTQQNAALVEEAAATSESMAQLARDLQSLVAKFKLDESYADAVSGTLRHLPAARQQERVLVAATGTHGRPARITSGKLHMISSHNGEDHSAEGRHATTSTTNKDDFEEF